EGKDITGADSIELRITNLALISPTLPEKRLPRRYASCESGAILDGPPPLNLEIPGVHVLHGDHPIDAYSFRGTDGDVGVADYVAEGHALPRGLVEIEAHAEISARSRVRISSMAESEAAEAARQLERASMTSICPPTS